VRKSAATMIDVFVDLSSLELSLGNDARKNSGFHAVLFKVKLKARSANASLPFRNGKADAHLNLYECTCQLQAGTLLQKH
jgi:hypothetical protein